MAHSDKIRHAKKRAVLAAYAEQGNLSRAVEIAGVARSMHYVWLDNDPAYATAFAEAEEQAADRLEGEARRRAFDGSDTLLIFLLKGARPDKYAERQKHEHAGELVKLYLGLDGEAG